MRCSHWFLSFFGFRESIETNAIHQYVLDVLMDTFVVAIDKLMFCAEILFTVIVGNDQASAIGDSLGRFVLLNYCAILSAVDPLEKAGSP